MPIAKLEFVPLHSGRSRKVAFARLPVVDELVYDDDHSYRVVSVFHPMHPSTKNLPIVRVTA